MEPPGPAMPPGYRHRQNKSWTPVQASDMLHMYLMVPVRIPYENSTAGLSKPESGHTMSGISFIGLGGMTRAIGARAVKGGNTVEVIGRDPAKAEDLAAALGGGATAGAFGTAPAGAF